MAGPAGVGKTRLAAELAGQIGAGDGSVHHTGSGGAIRGETLAAIANARVAVSPGLWVLDDLNLYPESIAALIDSVEAIESRPALVVGLLRDAGGDLALTTLIDRVDRYGDGHRRLVPLDLEGVRSIARWYVHEVADLPAESILRASGGIPSAVHELVTQWAGSEARRRLEAAADWLAEGRSKQAAGLRFADNLIAANLGRIYDPARTEVLAHGCPYKGLRAFDESDAGYFFGREQLVGELAARTVGSGFLGVVGPSGCGKSSLVLAGLIPSLGAGLLPGSERWDHVALRPGARPEAALDHALSQVTGGDRLVVVVDQFEEIFTATKEGDERDAFIGRLVELAHQPGVVVVVTIRADYTGHCAPYADLAGLLASNLVLVGPMTAEQLRRSIEAPARRVGLRVESSLVDALVADVADEPGGLPLLSTALVELWQAREAGWLRFGAYQRSGGVRTAVARLAESCYEQLSEAERDVARTVFLRLVGPGESDSAVRRRVPLSEFDVDEEPAVAAVLFALTRDRLLTRGEGQVEIAHEALVREWPRLTAWLQEDTAGRQLRGHLTQSARQWAERGRDPGDLYRGARLSAALDLRRGDDRLLNVLEREFLTQSRDASERQLERQRRANRRLRALLVGTAVFLLVALIAGVFAVVQRDQAQRAQKAADAQALKADSERVGTLAQTQPSLDRSLLLAVAAVKLDNLPETRGDLLGALQRSPAAFRFIRPSTNEITGLAVSRAGDFLAVGDSGGAVRFEDLRTWRPSGAAVQLPAPIPPLGVRFSPDGRTLAVATGQGNQTQLYVIDVASRRPRLIGTWSGGVPRVPAGSTTLAFSPDSSRIAVALADQPSNADTLVSERLVLLEAATGKIVWRRAYPLAHGQSEAQVGFTPGGGIVTSAEQGATDVWDAHTGRIVRRFPIGGRFALSPNGQLAAIALNSPTQVNPTTSLTVLNIVTGAERALQDVAASTWTATVAFAPGSGDVVSGSLDGDVRVWDVASGAMVQTFVSQTGGRLQVAVDPSGRTVVSGGDDGSVSAWDLSGTQALGRTFAWSRPGNSCQFAPCFVINPAGTIMATDEADGTVDLIDLRSRRWYATLPATRGLLANGLAFTPDGRTLITGDAGGNIIIWDVRTLGVLRRLRLPDPVYWLAVSPDTKLLAVQTQAINSTDTTVEVLDFSTGAALHTYTVPDGSAGLAYSSDGQELAALGCCSPGSKIVVWDTASGAELFSPRLPAQAQSIAFSPTTAVLAAGTADGELILWDARRGQEVGAPIAASASNADGIAFSSDGRLLATGLRSGGTLIFDLQSRQQLGGSFPVEGGAVPEPLFEPNGDLVINYVGTATEWPTTLGAWERFACQVAGRDLTPTEWGNVLPDRPYEHICPD